MKTDRPAEILDLEFSREPLSPLPDLKARIWRYMDLAKFVSMLQNNALYFPVVADLGDNLEAAPPRLPSNASAMERQSAFSSWSLFRCINFASCWHLAEDESAAMWAIYAGRHQGIAIQSTLQALFQSFPVAAQEDANGILKIGRVEYTDPDREEVPKKLVDSYAAVLRKRHWYRYEEEVRIICSPPDNWMEPTSMNSPGGFQRAGVWVRWICEN
jgi:hypothetical protein